METAYYSDQEFWVFFWPVKSVLRLDFDCYDVYHNIYTVLFSNNTRIRFWEIYDKQALWDLLTNVKRHAT